MTANHLAIRRALLRQAKLEDARREINRQLCGVRQGIRDLLGLAPPVGMRARKGRPAGGQGGKSKRTKEARRVPIGCKLHSKTAGRKRNGKGAAK